LPQRSKAIQETTVSCPRKTNQWARLSRRSPTAAHSVLFRAAIGTPRLLLYPTRDLPGSSSILGELATDLATEHGENDPNKRDRVKQAGRKDGN